MFGHRTNVISKITKDLLLLICVLVLIGINIFNVFNKTPTCNCTSSQVPVLDVYGKPISIPATAPQRIVSLVPSVSEILASLHLQSRVVGVDYNTDYPADLTAKPRVSDSSGNYNLEQIVKLKPDLVLSTGGLTKAYDSQLVELNLHVIDFQPANFAQLLQQISLIGQITRTSDTASELVQRLQQQVDIVKAKVARTSTPSVLLEVDNSTPGKPFVFGGGSFGDELVQYARGSNIFHNDATNQGYPQVTDKEIINANPQYIILTESLAYGGNPDSVYKRANWSGVAALQVHHVYRINANLIQRPGPRLVEGLQCLAQILHPDKFSGSLPDYCSATV